MPDEIIQNRRYIYSNKTTCFRASVRRRRGTLSTCSILLLWVTSFLGGQPWVSRRRGSDLWRHRSAPRKTKRLKSKCDSRGHLKVKGAALRVSPVSSERPPSGLETKRRWRGRCADREHRTRSLMMTSHNEISVSECAVHLQ